MTEKFFKQNAALLIMLVTALFLRIFSLADFPPDLRNDEASLGYNAYSILKTGKDEHGEFLPTVFKSFGDWKMGGYIYLTVPFVAILGLNELSVRLPSAIFGILCVWLMYEIALQIFANSAFASKKLALISGIVFALSPLYITFSRGAWEVNVSLALTLFAILFFLKAVNGKRKLLLVSALFFGLTLLTSHTAKLSSPIILGVLGMSYWRQFKEINIRLITMGVLIGMIFVIPVGLSFIEGKFSRIMTLNIFSYHSEIIPLLQSIATRWFSLYSASTLFIKGDTNPQHTPPNTGPFLLLDSIFLAVGAIRLIQKGTYQQNIFIWVSLLLLSLPSALTIEKTNLERVLPMFIPMILIISIGIQSLWEIVKSKYGAKFIFATFIFLYALNYFYFLDQYFIHATKKTYAGYREIVEKVIPIQYQYQHIFVQQSLEHPYIFFLFYQKYDPYKYQQIVKDIFVPNKGGKDMGQVLGFENIVFTNIDWERNEVIHNALYVMPVYKLNQQSEFYRDYKFMDEAKDLNGFPLFKIVEI